MTRRISSPPGWAASPSQERGGGVGGTVRVKFLVQEHITTPHSRAQTQTARSGASRTNHVATAPRTFHVFRSQKLKHYGVMPKSGRDCGREVASVEA